MNTLPEVVLSIWIHNQGFVTQGKYCEISGKPHFICNMTEKKLWRNFNGYSIAKRVLDAFKKAHVSPQIVYKRVDQNVYYLCRRYDFEKKGILVKYGGHSQWVLPLKNWEVKAGQFEEPHNLPVMNVDKWLKPAQLVPEPTTERERFYQWYSGV